MMELSINLDHVLATGVHLWLFFKVPQSIQSMANYFSSMATASNRKLFGICSHFCTHTHNACLDNIHLHTAVSHGHGVISQGVTGNLAVIRAADRSERA